MAERSGDILVVGPAWVGDMVLSQVLYRELASRHPGAAIDVLAPGWTAPLVQCMPEVRRAIDLPLAHGELGLARRWRTGRALRGGGYRQAIVLPNSFKSALPPWVARIPTRTGWRGEHRYGLLNDLRHLDPEALPTMAQRFLALGLPRGAALPDPVPAPRLAVDAQEARDTAARLGLAAERPLLALCPGAEFGGAKRWPPEHFAALARHFMEEGWQSVLLGSKADSDSARRVAGLVAAPADCRDLAGRTSLVEAVQVLSTAGAVVSNDSGLMHVAAALARPLAAVFGPTPTVFTPPLSLRAAVLAPSPTLDCAPCRQRECPLGHHRCMRETAPEKVAASLRAVLAAPGAGP